MDNPVFIVGLPRTGSTLWLNLVSKNPEIFGIGELLFLTPPWRKDFRYFLKNSVGNLSNQDNIKKMIELMFSGNMIQGITASFWQYEAKKFDTPDLRESIYCRVLESDKSLSSIFKAFIEEISNKNGFNRCCVKFPVFVNYIPELLKWYPNCKIIHITRDPRAIAVSRAGFHGEKKIKNRELMMLFAMAQYIWTSKLHFKYRKINNYALFRYEDLLSNPEKTIRQLCNFAEIDFDPQMLAPQEGQASSITGKKSAGFNGEAAYRWKDAITPMEEKIITAFTIKSMKRFGYEGSMVPG